MKELPYFKFEPAEWIVGNINYCSFETQGVFISVICQYWLCNCDMSKRTLSERFANAEKQISELIAKGIIKENDDKINILFLDELFEKRTRISAINSKNGMAGALVRRGVQANAKRTLSEKQANANIREEKRRDNNIYISEFEKYKSEPYFELYKTCIDVIKKTPFSKMEEQLTYEQFVKLYKKSKDLGIKLGDMFNIGINTPKYLNGKKSIYLTINNWINNAKKH